MDQKYAKYELYAIYRQYIWTNAIHRKYMLNIKNMPDMQYMQYGCIYAHMAIQHIRMKYLGPFWTTAKSVSLSVSSSSGLPRWEPATPPRPKLTEHARARTQWRRAHVQGKAPACSAFAGKVSECVCVCAARTRGTCTCSLRRRCVDSRGPPCARLSNDPASCGGAGPAGVDRWSDREPSICPLVVLEPQNHELDIRLRPVGFMLVKIHRRMGALNWWGQTEQAQETPLELDAFMGRHRVTDDQIKMVQSQEFQHFLTCVPAGSHKFWAIVGRRLIQRSSAVNRQKICISPGSFWFINIYPLCISGNWKVISVCVSPWFLPSPEICFGTTGHVLHEAIVHILQVCGWNWAFLPGVGIGPARKSVRNTHAN